MRQSNIVRLQVGLGLEEKPTIAGIKDNNSDAFSLGARDSTIFSDTF